MDYIESSTKIIRAPDTRADAPTILIKDTCTVEDILYLMARRAATSKVRDVDDFITPAIARTQITRVPHVQ
jgi:hypothetical protein